MKYVVLLCCIFTLSDLDAQCTCPEIPLASSGILRIVVKNATELDQALHTARSNNGRCEILLENGIYQLSQNLLYIDPSMSDLTIRSLNRNADSVIIRGAGMNGQVTHIFNVAAKRFTAADMTIGWVANHAIQIHSESDADSCLIQNVRIYDIGEQMIKGSGNDNGQYSDDCRIQCCHFQFTDGVASQYYTGGIDGHKTRNWLVFNNTFIDIRSPDNRLAEHAIHFWNGCEGTIVKNNTILNCDRGIGFGLGQKGHFGGLIANNMVFTTRDVGIGLESSPDTRVYHNTVVTAIYFNSIEYRFGATQNVHIANNLVNELISSRDGGEGVIESNYFFNDPDIFVNFFLNDYHLSGEVHGITNAGIVIPEIGDDFDCESRDLNGPTDIGADELRRVSTYTNMASLSHMGVSPNPCYDFVNLKGEVPPENIWLIDPVGRKFKLKENKGKIDLSSFPPGIYHFVVRHGAFRETMRLVKLAVD